MAKKAISKKAPSMRKSRNTRLPEPCSPTMAGLAAGIGYFPAIVTLAVALLYAWGQVTVTSRALPKMWLSSVPAFVITDPYVLFLTGVAAGLIGIAVFIVAENVEQLMAGA